MQPQLLFYRNEILRQLILKECPKAVSGSYTPDGSKDMTRDQAMSFALTLLDLSNQQIGDDDDLAHAYGELVLVLMQKLKIPIAAELPILNWTGQDNIKSTKFATA